MARVRSAIRIQSPLDLLYMQTMAVRDQDRFIELGGSLHEWMKRLGVPVGGKSYTHIREQARRLSACTMYLGYATEEGGEATTKTAIANTILLAPSRPYGSETTSNPGIPLGGAD